MLPKLHQLPILNRKGKHQVSYNIKFPSDLFVGNNNKKF